MPTNPATPTAVEALRGIANRAEGCIEVNKLRQYQSWRENRAEGVKLNAKVKTAQTLCNIEETARQALPAAQREAEVREMLVEALEELVADCEALELEDEIEAGENGNGSMVKARKALKAATGGAET